MINSEICDGILLVVDGILWVLKVVGDFCVDSGLMFGYCVIVLIIVCVLFME